MSIEFFYGLILLAPVIFFSLTVHEFAHGYSAYLMGDMTAKAQGRLTLNPLAHLDPIGTICILFAPIGWAKPVPINPLNFRDPSRGMFLSAAAGPATNLAVAIVVGLVVRAMLAAGARPHLPANGIYWLDVVFLELGLAAFVNVGLAVFNLLPIYPLDGHHLLRETLKGEARMRFIEMQRRTSLILFFLIFAPYLIGIDLLGYVIMPPIEFILRGAMGDVGLMVTAHVFHHFSSFVMWI